jgi:hypothetical protein
MYRFWRFLLILMVFSAGLQSRQAGRAQPDGSQASILTLAGQRVEVELPFAVPQFLQSAPDDALQVATSVRWAPFFEVSLSAEPLPPETSPQVSQAGRDALATGQAQSLQELRGEQSASALPTNRILFFDRQMESVSNRVALHLRPDAKEPVIIHEWVTISGQHSWTFRVSYTPGQAFDETLLEQVVIRAAGPARPGDAQAPGAARTESTGRPPGAVAAQDLADPGDDLPAPAWWDGDCDAITYQDKSGLEAYPLGGVYRGVAACGPRPWKDGAPDVLVRFFDGAWGTLEWQCVELSMRFLFLACGTPPYPGNGKDVVANYPGKLLMKIPNGSSLRGPKPGDIISYGPTTTYGHTAVVSAASIDEHGNGTVTVIEQNASETGEKTHSVSNWYIQSAQTVSGWLHEPTGDPELPLRVFLPAIVFGK